MLDACRITLDGSALESRLCRGETAAANAAANVRKSNVVETLAYAGTCVASWCLVCVASVLFVRIFLVDYNRVVGGHDTPGQFARVVRAIWVTCMVAAAFDMLG